MNTFQPHARAMARLMVFILAGLMLGLGQTSITLAKTGGGSHHHHHKADSSQTSCETGQQHSGHHHPRRGARSATGGERLVRAKAAYLLDLNNGKVLYAQDADRQIAPASITKVLTLYLIREALAQGHLRPDTLIPVSSLAVRTGGSTMSLYRGEKVPVSELIKGISVVSANNACVAVAEYLGKGDSRAFVSRMNAKAKSLGMNRSVFKNPNGLPAAGQLTTARDIANLSANYLRRFPEALAVHSMTSYTYNGVTHHNANSLLGRYEGVDGLKTGFVCASGYNITATAKVGGTRLVAVVLGASNPIIRETETVKLLDYGFSHLSHEKSPGQSKIHATN